MTELNESSRRRALAIVNEQQERHAAKSHRREQKRAKPYYMVRVINLMESNLSHCLRIAIEV